MQKRRGRTGRLEDGGAAPTQEEVRLLSLVSESYRSEFIELKKWLKERKFEDTGLAPAYFPGTGRGLMSKTPLQDTLQPLGSALSRRKASPGSLQLAQVQTLLLISLLGKDKELVIEGQTIISLPESCLLTTDTVIRSALGPYIKKWKPPPSPLLALCTFLVSEKHAGHQSPWKPYLDILPKSYTCPVCLEPEVPLFVEPVDNIFTYHAFLWAWCTVNTRAVYLRSRRHECLSAEPDTCALAPYLDLLNHSPHVQVKAAFNEKTGCYEITAASHCRKHREVFICYGPHDNQRLLLEYGFVSFQVLVKCLPPADKQAHKKMSILKDHGFTQNLTFGWDGPSWRLLTALKLLCLEAEQFTSWKRVLLGEVISDTNEKTSLGVAQKICSDFIAETQAVLHKVSDMKEGKVSLRNQLPLVEALRAEELQILQASAEILSSLLAPFP